MFLTIIIAFFSLIALVVIHELGHFTLAKMFGVKVEEFGLGYPPRLFGRKIGETIYSLNLLPFGAFVKIYGQEEKVRNRRSFSEKTFWQKSLIILGGVFSFWIVAAILLTIVMALGVPTMIDDEENHNLVDPRVQIMAVSSGSPAEQAGLKVGDAIKNFDKVKEIQEFTQTHKGEKIILTIQRGKEVFDVSLVPRVSLPANEGPMGVALVRTAIKVYPWYIAPIKGVETTGILTIAIIKGWAMVLGSLIQGKGVPAGVEIGGPVKIFELFIDMGNLGIDYLLRFIAFISISLALINILPIPALDGGWFLFLVIERLRRKPINQKILQNISAAFYFLLIALMIWVTIKDISRFFI